MSLLTRQRGITLARDLPGTMGAIPRQKPRNPYPSQMRHAWSGRRRAPLVGRYATRALMGRYANRPAGMGRLGQDFYEEAYYDDYGYYDIDWASLGDPFASGEISTEPLYLDTELSEPVDDYSWLADWFGPADEYAYGYAEADPFAVETVELPTELVAPAEYDPWAAFNEYIAQGVPSEGYINANGEWLIFNLNDPEQAAQFDAMNQLFYGTPPELLQTTSPELPTQLTPPGEGNWFTNLLNNIFGGSSGRPGGASLPGSSGTPAPKASATKPSTPATPTSPTGAPTAAKSWFEQQSIMSGVPNWGLLAVGAAGVGAFVLLQPKKGRR